MVRASKSCKKVKSYFKRYQVKPKRRRQGKTDYAARRGLIAQPKAKYGTPKYRLVARKTNKRIIAQVYRATMTGDICLAEAHSAELARFGIPVGHTNYPSAYCTGLLLARRLLTKLKLADKYKGKEEVDGEYYDIADDEEQEDEEINPLKAYLDVGLTRTTTGNNVFGVLKGAVDGGLSVPHNWSGKRFPGYDKEANDGEGELDAGIHRARIFGQHIGDNMRRLEEENEDGYKKQYSQYIKNGITADKLEDMYNNAHQKIRANPARQPKKPKQSAYSGEHKRKPKLTCAERRINLKKRIAALLETKED